LEKAASQLLGIRRFLRDAQAGNLRSVSFYRVLIADG
jgi:hypothetical protein